MPNLELSPKQVNMFVDVFLLGNEIGANEDTSAVVRLIKQLRPAEYRLVVVEAWQLIRAQDFITARQLLEQADAANPKQPMLKVLLAFCLLSQGDSLWQSYLEDIRYLQASEEVQTIARTLEEFAQNCPVGASGQQMGVMASLLT
jgi:thioredoxin-like negative regulator of GroEL